MEGKIGIERSRRDMIEDFSLFFVGPTKAHWREFLFPVGSCRSNYKDLSLSLSLSHNS